MTSRPAPSRAWARPTRVPGGNLFPVGTAKTRPEIYAMGFRQPFTLHTDPKNPGIVGVGEFCHDNGTTQADRSPAGTCEWNLINQASNHGWPYCVGDNSTANTTFRWNYQSNATTNQRYDCSLTNLPSDIRSAPAGQTAAEPTFDGLDTLPGPVVPATIWKKYDATNVPAFGDLSAGGMSPVAGPIYRYPEGTASQGAFPRYYDGSWLINNRGAESGFWKEVRMRTDNNQMLRMQDWLPYNAAGAGSANANGFVIGSQFGDDGQLYLARFFVGCCRSNTSETNQTQIVKISFNVQDECLTDESAPNASHRSRARRTPASADTYVNTAQFRLTGNDVGCAGVKSLEYRQQGTTDWLPYTAAVTFEEGKTYNLEYRATDRKDNVSAVKTATFTILKIQDETAPTANATTAGNVDQRGNFVGSTTLTVTATDNDTGSGVEKIEYRVNGGAYTTYTTPVAFTTPGVYDVDYRATDKVNNTSEPKRVSFRILSGAGCTQSRSDEFNGSTLGSLWQRHTRNGGTPTEGALAPTLADGVLTIPTNNFELDSNPVGHGDRPGQLHRPGPAGTRRQLVGGDAVHGRVHRRLAARGPDRVEGRQQLLPLHDHARPQRRHDVRRAVQGQRVQHRGRPHAGRRQRHDLADQGSGHDPDALHARLRLQHRRAAVPRDRPGERGQPRLGQLPGRGELPGPQPDGRRRRAP